MLCNEREWYMNMRAADAAIFILFLIVRFGEIWDVIDSWVNWCSAKRSKRILKVVFTSEQHASDMEKLSGFEPEGMHKEEILRTNSV